jgi:hypothetical protein
VLSGGGTNGEPDKPHVWISAFAGGVWILDTCFSNYQSSQYVRLGICSNGDRSGTCGSSSITIDNSGGNFGGYTPGRGPGVDIGSNTFWVWIRNSDFSGGEGIYTIPPGGLVRAAGITTATIPSFVFQGVTNNLSLTPGQSFTIYGADDPSFNGPFSVLAATPNTVTYSQPGAPDATSGNGSFWTDRAYSFVNNPGSGAGSAEIYLKDVHVHGGGIRVTSGYSGAGVDVDVMNGEAPFGPGAAGVEILNGTTATSKVSHVEMADASNHVPGLLVWNGYGAAGNTSVSYTSVSGAATVLNGPTLNPQLSPRRAGIVGMFGNSLIGDLDNARRLFSPVTVRYTNLAPNDPAMWVPFGAAAITPGALAPDGTHGAGEVACTSGPGTQCAVTFRKITNVPISQNEWFICGFWVSNPYSPFGISNAYMQQAMDGYGGGDYYYPDANSSTPATFYVAAPRFSDGDWHWMYTAKKVWTNPSNAGLGCGSWITPGTSERFYGPVFLRIPAGDLSDNEVFEHAAALGSYSDVCPIGLSCDEQGPVPHLKQINGVWVCCKETDPAAPAPIHRRHSARDPN